MSTNLSKDRASLCLFTFADGRRCRTPRTSAPMHLPRPQRIPIPSRSKSRPPPRDLLLRPLPLSLRPKLRPGPPLLRRSPRPNQTQNRLHPGLPGPNPPPIHPSLPTRIHQRLRHRLLASSHPRLLRPPHPSGTRTPARVRIRASRRIRIGARTCARTGARRSIRLRVTTSPHDSNENQHTFQFRKPQRTLKRCHPEAIR
jgi:hypothetical protein